MIPTGWHGIRVANLSTCLWFGVSPLRDSPIDGASSRTEKVSLSPSDRWRDQLHGHNQDSDWSTLHSECGSSADRGGAATGTLALAQYFLRSSGKLPDLLKNNTLSPRAELTVAIVPVVLGLPLLVIAFKNG